MARTRAVAATASVLIVGLLAAGSAGGQSLERELSERRSQLSAAEQRQGVLSTSIEQAGQRLDTLRSQVAVLRNQEAALQAELDQAEAELTDAARQLQVVRERLRRAVKALRQRLVSIYKSGEPETMTLLLEAEGFDDLATRYEYLGAIQQRDDSIVDTVTDLRDQARETVERMRATRDAVAAKQAELASTRAQLESREGQLASAQAAQQAELSRVEGQVVRLDRGVSHLQGEIEKRLQAAEEAAAAAEAEQTAAPPAPAPAPAPPSGPVQGESSSGMIWPVEGSLTSPFGMRWGRLHAGIDVAAPGGTPIRAAQAGTITLAEPYGGYGNYTCVDHGGGLSTCYAHQSAFELTGGSVEQGQVIGYVGNTGNSFGDHLHFEVRVNGEPVDPLGYL